MSQIFSIRNTAEELVKIPKMLTYDRSIDWFHGGNPPANRSKKSKKK